MIDLYYFPTSNTWKVSIMLEETGLEYRVVPIDILNGGQMDPEFLKISPNNKVPAIVDHDGPEGSVSIFESGAILMYLAEKTGRFLPSHGNARVRALEWLFWQVGGLGPIAGQTNTFRTAMPDNQQAVDRFVNAARHLYGVLDRQLAGNEWIAGEYGIADMASWGWVWFHRMHGQDLEEFAEVKRWFNAMSERPAVKRAKNIGLEHVSDKHRKIYDGPFFGSADVQK